MKFLEKILKIILNIILSYFKKLYRVLIELFTVSLIFQWHLCANANESEIPTVEKNNDYLPVEITSFTYSIEGTDVILSWTVAQQVNNFGFYVERKDTSNDWTEIGFVYGDGTWWVPKSFSLTDYAPEAGTYHYRLKQVDMDGTEHYYNEILVVTIAPSVNVDEKLPLFPLKYSLQNYPNPFNPSTLIQFSVPIDGRVFLNLFNILGEEVAVLFNDVAQAGKIYIIRFDSRNLTSGIYFACLQQNLYKMGHKMVLVR